MKKTSMSINEVEQLFIDLGIKNKIKQYISWSYFCGSRYGNRLLVETKQLEKFKQIVTTTKNKKNLNLYIGEYLRVNDGW